MGDDESKADKGIEIEQGPAVAGPDEGTQYVRSQAEQDALDAANPVAPPDQPDKVFNVGDEEIEAQRAQQGESAAQGEYDYGRQTK